MLATQPAYHSEWVQLWDYLPLPPPRHHSCWVDQPWSHHCQPGFRFWLCSLGVVTFRASPSLASSCMAYRHTTEVNLLELSPWQPLCLPFCQFFVTYESEWLWCYTLHLTMEMSAVHSTMPVLLSFVQGDVYHSSVCSSKIDHRQGEDGAFPCLMQPGWSHLGF